MNRLLRMTYMALLAVAAPATALATPATWNAADGDFTVAGNWLDGVLPSASDTTYIANNGAAWLNSAYAASIAGLTVGAASDVGHNGSGTFTLQTNGSLTTSGATVGSGGVLGSTTGTMNVDGGAFNSTTIIYLGTGSTNPGYGFYNQTGGAVTLGGQFYAGVYGANSVGIANISGGTLSTTYVASGCVADVGSKGMWHQTGGDITITRGFFMGLQPTGYGYYDLSGGTLYQNHTPTAGNSGYNFTVGKYGYGVMDQTGGTVTAVSRLLVGGDVDTAATQNCYGVYNLSGGTATVCTSGTSNLYYSAIGALANGNGVLNLSGMGSLEVQGGTTYGRLIVGYNTTSATVGSSGIVNLGAVASTEDPDGGGGALAVNWLERSNNSYTTGTVNFHGGTLKARNANTNFLLRTTNYVYGEGAVIDTNGKNVTIATVLDAPGGKGIKSITLASTGTGYTAPPLVVISGGGGSGATAIAKLNEAGNIDRIVITNPGVGYTDSSTVALTFYGGDGAGAALGTGSVTLADNVSGGLTKRSAGTLTLSAANTYKGQTLIEAGTLKLASTGSIANSSTIHVGADSFFDVLAYPTFGLGGTQTLKGNGTVTGTVATAAGSHVQPGASLGTLTVTGNLTVGGTLDVEFNSTTDAIDLLAVSGTLDLSAATIQFSDLGTGPGGPGHPAVFATYGTLVGTAVATPGVPAGYWVDYHYNSENKIALVPEPSTIVLLILSGMGLALCSPRRRAR
jgi:autotransporter-associated beta strand protein